MKNYPSSDYALNKHSSGIVYRFADEIVEVTLAGYLAENPDKNEADFRVLKAFSDEDYHDQDKADYRQTWKDTPFDALAETELCSVPSPEAAVIDAPEEAERQRRRAALAKKALGRLTDVQRRRYLLYHAGGLSTRQIAEKECVAQRSVMDCLELAKKKIKKVFRLRRQSWKSKSTEKSAITRNPCFSECRSGSSFSPCWPWARR